MLLTAIVFSACSNFDWEDNHNTTLSDFRIMTQDTTIVINQDHSNINDDADFTWSKSKAGDNTAVFYKILFSTTDDFSNPIYEVETENLSTYNEAHVSFKTLNIIAEQAGIEQGKTGILKWTVRASNGVVQKKISDIRSITLTRPTGFAYNPDKIILKCKGTDDVVLKKIDDGIFEAFTNMVSGTYSLYESGSKIGRHFGIDHSVLSENGDFLPVKSGINHIYINFNTAQAQIAYVQGIGLWYSGINDVVAVMAPTGNMALWTTTYQFNALNQDYRYKFRITEELNTGTTQQSFYGYARQSATNQTATTADNYFYLFKENGLSQSDYCFKFNNRGLHDGKTLKITIDLRPSTVNYTHSVIVVQ